MDDPIIIDHAEAHEKLTARLFWKRTSESGYNDAGSVKEFANASSRSTVKRFRATNGARHLTTELADACEEAYTFLLDERDAAAELLIGAATQLTDRTQGRAEGQTASITNVTKGKWFTIGSYNIANLAVTANLSGALDEDVDYVADLQNGRIKIPLEAVVADGETLTLTFDRPALQFQNFKSQQDVLFHCDFIIEEHDQYSDLWLRRAAFSGYLHATEFPNHTGEFGTHRVRVVPDAPVTWEKRSTADALVQAPETPAPAGQSSSSSSNSSATSSQSSSSSST